MTSYVQLNINYRMNDITWDMLSNMQKQELRDAYLDVMEVEKNMVDDRIKYDLRPVPQKAYESPMHELFEEINNMNKQYYKLQSDQRAKRWGLI